MFKRVVCKVHNFLVMGCWLL